jgi:Ser-tRNA(Ala) deacylase AlaX
MERAEAEAHFGRGIYELVASWAEEEEEGRAPSGPRAQASSTTPSSLVRVVRIPDWDASVCPTRHVETTGAIGTIRVEAVTFDETRKQIRIEFGLAAQ